jgi:hypothetical protein
MLTGLRSHSMASRSKRKKGGVWGVHPQSSGAVGYAVLTGEEAVLCGAEPLGFHPRTGDALAWIWPDGRIGCNAVYFSRSDAEEIQEFARGCLSRSE